MNLLVYITVPDASLARSLARELVERRLAAGVNVAGPVSSFYRWEGRLHEAREWQLFAQATDCAALEAFVCSRHPHLVPCIIGIDIACGNKSFLDWISAAGEVVCAPQS